MSSEQLRSEQLGLYGLPTNPLSCAHRRDYVQIEKGHRDFLDGLSLLANVVNYGVGAVLDFFAFLRRVSAALVAYCDEYSSVF